MLFARVPESLNGNAHARLHHSLAGLKSGNEPVSSSFLQYKHFIILAAPGILRKIVDSATRH